MRWLFCLFLVKFPTAFSHRKSRTRHGMHEPIPPHFTLPHPHTLTNTWALRIYIPVEEILHVSLSKTVQTTTLHMNQIIEELRHEIWKHSTFMMRFGQVIAIESIENKSKRENERDASTQGVKRRRSQSPVRSPTVASTSSQPAEVKQTLGSNKRAFCPAWFLAWRVTAGSMQVNSCRAFDNFNDSNL